MAEEITLREHMKRMAAVKSEKRIEAAKQNLKALHGDQEILGCQCGEIPHKTFCPVWRRENKRNSKSNGSPRTYNVRKRDESEDPFHTYADQINAEYRKRPTPCGEFTGDEWELLCIMFDFQCARCRETKPLLADHIVSVHNGGRNEIANIQPLCRSCNSYKNSKTTDYRGNIDMSDQEKIREAMSILGQRKSERKKTAGQANLQKANAARTLKPCTCGASEEQAHKGTCPVYQREYLRKKKGYAPLKES